MKTVEASARSRLSGTCRSLGMTDRALPSAGLSQSTLRFNVRCAQAGHNEILCWFKLPPLANTGAGGGNLIIMFLITSELE